MDWLAHLTENEQGQHEIFTLMRNVTAEVESQEQLEQAHQRILSLFRHSFSQLQINSFLFDGSSRILEPLSDNDIFRLPTDYPRDFLFEFWPVAQAERMHPDDRPRVMPLQNRACANAEPYEVEYRLLDLKSDPPGYFWVREVSTVLPWTLSSPSEQLLVLVQDITKEKRDEQSRTTELMLEASKLRIVALGTLAVNIGHELRSPLQGIYARLDLMEIQMLRGRLEQASASAEIVRGHVAHASTIMNRMLRLMKRDHFGHKQVQPRPVDLLAILHRTQQKPSKHPTAADVMWETTMPERAVFALGIPEDFEASLRELIDNALKALSQATYPLVHLKLYETSTEAVLQVHDTGCGMDESTQMRCFDPFFTTREPGYGTGMGLTFVCNVISDMGGRILVNSSLGQGTTMTINLPLASVG
jgi:signal transduction histidine kinase